MRILAALLVSSLACVPVAPAAAAAAPEQASEPFVVEFYYKIQWGHAEEWLGLVRKNYLPLLEADLKRGRVLEFTLQEPRYHATEESRWDYRITVAYRDASAAYAPGLDAEARKALFPDQETYKREEKRRFEIVLAHWDVPIKTGPLASK